MVTSHVLGLGVDLGRIRKTLLISRVLLLVRPGHLEVLLFLRLLLRLLVFRLVSPVSLLFWAFALLRLRRLRARLHIHFIQTGCLVVTIGLCWLCHWQIGLTLRRLSLRAFDHCLIALGLFLLLLESLLLSAFGVVAHFLLSVRIRAAVRLGRLILSLGTFHLLCGALLICIPIKYY